MADKPTENGGRDELGRFGPGNPGPGRPKKTEELAASIRDFDDELRDRLMKIARYGKDKESTGAIKLLWSYGHGLPRQVVTDADGKSVRLGIIVLPAEES